ncbi:hypothetical protein ACTMSW_06420 [Micromonospora sp. BQ11]|uniref:hypothetical protein n=1 Tax=Micromonospora sp. BQ11 TaxID=3452212 RepID=UPI003F89A5BB
MQVDPPENRGLAALMITSGVGGLVLLLAGDGERTLLVLALVAFACFLVCLALLGLSSVLQEHEQWRANLVRQRPREQDEDAKR